MSEQTGLVRYEQARVALAECVKVDEAAEMRDKAAAMALYARQRDDKQMEAWVKEIHLRACIRIGELSRDLDKAQGSGGGRPVKDSAETSSGRTEDVSTKAKALAEAGISTSTAHEYEQLAGGRDEQAQAAVKAGAEAYLAEVRAEGEVPTLAGLKAAVREAVVATLGPPPARPRAAPSPPPDPRYAMWAEWAAAVEHLATADVSLPTLAAFRPHYRQELIDFARRRRLGD
jgi:hypothetical protein